MKPTLLQKEPCIPDTGKANINSFFLFFWLNSYGSRRVMSVIICSTSSLIRRMRIVTRTNKEYDQLGKIFRVNLIAIYLGFRIKLTVNMESDSIREKVFITTQLQSFLLLRQFVSRLTTRRLGVAESIIILTMAWHHNNTETSAFIVFTCLCISKSLL